MMLKICKCTDAFCPPDRREDQLIKVKTDNQGIPVGNSLALDAYNNPENYAGKYEIIEE